MEPGSRPIRESVEFARIVAFTDGVFAIAITLLVLSLEVPPDLRGADLHDFLLDSWRQFFAYFLSFAVIGRFWIAHHGMFSLLHDFDRRLLALNLVYLSLIVLIPSRPNCSATTAIAPTRSCSTQRSSAARRCWSSRGGAE